MLDTYSIDSSIFSSSARTSFTMPELNLFNVTPNHSESTLLPHLGHLSHSNQSLSVDSGQGIVNEFTDAIVVPQKQLSTSGVDRAARKSSMIAMRRVHSDFLLGVNADLTGDFGADSLTRRQETGSPRRSQQTSSTKGEGVGAPIYLYDTEILNLTRSLLSDGQLGRSDMINILRNSEDQGVVDNNELTDLRTLVSNGSQLNMSASVQKLTSKVVNGDVANRRFGNLFSGSSAAQMRSLTNKWFYGSDLPTLKTGSVYRNWTGSLFYNGASYQDVKQGGLADCYFMAGLAATAFRSPSTIQNMLTDNGDGTFTVRFFNRGVADYVTVNRDLPTNHSNGLAYGRSDYELWVALAEKAYAQLNESGWIGQDGTNSYQGIESGWGGLAIHHITGWDTNIGSSINPASIVNQFNSGKAVILNSKDGGTDSKVIGNHAYVMLNYNSSTGKYILFNPWGIGNRNDPGTIALSADQIRRNFSSWDYTV